VVIKYEGFPTRTKNADQMDSPSCSSCSIEQQFYHPTTAKLHNDLQVLYDDRRSYYGFDCTESTPDAKKRFQEQLKLQAQPMLIMLSYGIEKGHTCKESQQYLPHISSTVTECIVEAISKSYLPTLKEDIETALKSLERYDVKLLQRHSQRSPMIAKGEQEDFANSKVTI